MCRSFGNPVVDCKLKPKERNCCQLMSVIALLYIAWKPMKGVPVYLQSLKQKLPMFTNFGEFNSVF